jgi:hypothetical protein
LRAIEVRFGSFWQWLFVGSAWLATAHAHADPLLDFKLFNPPVAAQRKIVEPVVTWLVRPDAETYCAKATPKDGYHARPEGCMFYNKQASSCTIVTTNSTTHSQLGHLFLQCIQGP